MGSDYLSSQLSSHFLGYVKASFGCLSFARSLPCGGDEQRLPQLDPKNVKRLARIFTIEGVKRDAKDHYIKAVASPSSLDAAVGGRDAIYASVAATIPTSKYELECLFGRHRVEAARTLLQVDDRWWIVEVYDEGLPYSVQWSIATQSSRDKRLPAGFIYSRLNDQQNPDKKWLASLISDNGGGLKGYEALCKEQNCDLKAALDDLIPLPGLWASFSFGVIERWLTMGMNRELAHYLRLVGEVWRKILLGREDLYPLLDADTVEAVELLHPLYSNVDRATVTRLVHRGTIFREVADAGTRQDILAVILSLNVRIPSLSTFQKDARFLWASSQIVKRLLPSRHGQIHEKCRSAHASADFDRHYIELWLSTLQRFEQLSDVKLKAVAAQSVGRTPEVHRRDLAEEASQLGFSTPEIDHLRRHDCLRTASEALLENFHPNLSPTSSRFRVDEMCALVKRPMKRRKLTKRPPDLTTDLIEVPKSQRRGIPYATNFRRYCKYLTFHYVYEYVHDLEAEPKLEYATSFSMIRDLIRAFFGEVPPTRRPETSTPGGEVLHSLVSVLERPVTSIYSESSLFDVSPTAESAFDTRRRGVIYQNTADAGAEVGTALHNLLIRIQDQSKFFLWDCERSRLFALSLQDPNLRAYLQRWWRAGHSFWVPHEGDWRLPRQPRVEEDIHRSGRFVVSRKNDMAPIRFWEDVLYHFQGGREPGEHSMLLEQAKFAVMLPPISTSFSPITTIRDTIVVESIYVLEALM